MLDMQGRFLHFSSKIPSVAAAQFNSAAAGRIGACISEPVQYFRSTAPRASTPQVYLEVDYNYSSVASLNHKRDSPWSDMQ
jgi:hypothetical protein